MSILQNTFSMHNWISFLFIVFSMILFPLENIQAASQLNSEKNTQPKELSQSFSLPVSLDSFEYQLEDRPDPFVPFLTEKIPELDPNEIIDSRTTLSGMQLFEPGQLTLVALMEKEGQFVAMVEDFNKKGYIIEEGLKIGRRGIVRAIIPNKVIIEETATTRSGKKLTTEIVMVLKKEGEE